MIATRVFNIHIGQTSAGTSVEVDGVDISGKIQAVSVSARAGKVTRVTLESFAGVGASLDLSGEYRQVPLRKQVKTKHKP